MARFTRQSFSLPQPMLADLRAEADRQGVSMSEVVREYLRWGRLGLQKSGLDLKREGDANDNGNE